VISVGKHGAERLAATRSVRQRPRMTRPLPQ
jgi:hypothetical protein